MMGTGSPFAYPGSMLGALLAFILYRRFRKLGFSAVGEVLGTGIIGSLATFPLIMILGLDRDFFWVLAPAFLISTVIGSVVSWLLLRQLDEKGVLKQFNI